VSSPITFSGFNNIDFNTVLNALIAQDSQPLTNLQTEQSNIKAQSTTYGTLATNLGTLDTAVQALGPTGSVTTLGATSSDPTSVAATVSGAGVAGQYDVIVNQLAKAQVTASASTAPDANTTVVATSGTITIGGVAVAISGPQTLQQLAATINGTTGIGVTASVIQAGTSSFRLVLTGTQTGAANAFTITNGLTGGTGVTFTDTNGDGVSGDTPADNAQQATNADVLVNNVEVVSASNTLTSAIPGVTLQLEQQDPTSTIAVTVAADGSSLASTLQNFISAYNSLQSFVTSQNTAAGSGDPTSIAHDSLFRGLQRQLTAVLQANYGTSALQNLAQIGVEFTQTGTLQLNSTMFQAAIATNPSAVQSLVAGSGSAFDSLSTAIETYTQGSGLISIQQTSLTNQATALGNQITDMQNRLNIERATLQAEFTAADTAISSLQSQTSSLTSLGNSMSTNSLSQN
jgi:flagellar hook-associated protein 2